MKLNPVGGVHLIGGRAVELSQRVLPCGVLAEDPERLPGDRVVLRSDVAAVAEDKARGSAGFLGRPRAARGSRRSRLPVLVSQVFNLVGEPLYLDGKLHVGAVIGGGRCLCLRSVAGGIRRIVIRIESGDVAPPPRPS